MDMLSVFLAVSVIVFIFLIILFIVARVSKNVEDKSKSKKAVLTANLKKLSQNPNNTKALMAVGEIYIEEKDWEKAFAVYAHLLEKSASLLPSEQLTININYGLAALNTKRIEEAKQGFLLARSFDQEAFQINYNLAYIYYLEKNYEKAIPLFRKSLIVSESNLQAKKYLGLAYRKDKKFHDALPYLSSTFEIVPDDKEVLFAIAECFFELGMNDNALKVCSRLRSDLVYGAESALYAGVLHMRLSQYENAAADFEIGLSHKNAKPEIQCELRYRYAQCCLKLRDIAKAILLLKQIQAISPSYRDVNELIINYQELNRNNALRVYLMAGQSEFIELCRKIVIKFFRNARVKIVDITVLTTHTDIVASVDTDRYTDTALFRFFRTQGTVGELSLRDMHEYLKELKAGSGVCCNAGNFTNEAVRFCESRPIELYPRERLNKLLSTINI